MANKQCLLYALNMRKIISFVFVLLLLLTPLVSDAYVSVKGYYRKDGTYVSPHVRSNPNGLKYDNYGYKPSQGLYNNSYGTRGSTWDTPTWTTDPDYYLGKSLYNSGSIYTPTYTPSYVPTYTTPTYTPTYTPSYTSTYTNYSGFNDYITKYGAYSGGKDIIDIRDKTPKSKKMKISEVALKYAKYNDCRSDFLTKKDQLKCKNYLKFKDNDKYYWEVSDNDKKSYRTCGESIYSIFKLEKTEKFVCNNGIGSIEIL